MRSRFPVSGDKKLIQIVDAAWRDTARRSGDWLVCRPGCTQCCVGVFSIHQLDAERLRRGMAQMEKQAPERAARVRERALAALSRLSPEFPGDIVSGRLHEGAEAEARFEAFANHEVCPALDPASGTCDLYEFRPMTCRVFGPPVQSQDGLGVCELCFRGASTEEVERCEMRPDPEGLEEELLKQFEKASERRGNTIIAFCLAR
ncbi:MAG: YkgJ family cysteine cluster protein [Acidobacteria bacterium]|nr:YkgJ family cysteine cluster protein [Acidobacteriota bacterium]